MGHESINLIYTHKKIPCADFRGPHKCLTALLAHFLLRISHKSDSKRGKHLYESVYLPK